MFINFKITVFLSVVVSTCSRIYNGSCPIIPSSFVASIKSSNEYYVPLANVPLESNHSNYYLFPIKHDPLLLTYSKPNLILLTFNMSECEEKIGISFDSATNRSKITLLNDAILRWNKVNKCTFTTNTLVSVYVDETIMIIWQCVELKEENSHDETIRVLFPENLNYVRNLTTQWTTEFKVKALKNLHNKPAIKVKHLIDFNGRRMTREAQKLISEICHLHCPPTKNTFMFLWMLLLCSVFVVICTACNFKKKFNRTRDLANH